MEYRLLPIFTLLNLALVATHGALPPEVYWKSVLPTTPMPKAITDILYPDWMEEKTSVNVGGGGVNVHTVKGGGTIVNVGGKGKGKGKGKGSGGVSVNTDHKGKPAYASVAPNSFMYNYAAKETQLHDDPNVALFFLENDLHSGAKFDLHFTRTSNTQATFLSRHVADSIPFSSNKVNAIFNKFSVKPGSEEGRAMKNTLSECEDAGIKGEEKYCATSLESMLDFTTSKLGKNVVVVSTQVDKETGLQKYTVATGLKKLAGGDKAVVCHKQNYPYAVFYCHKTETTRAYSVPLEGANGIRVKAVAVCHTDTSEWNPKHLAFQVLKVKPGTLPVCHFLPEDHVVWVPK